MAKNVTLKVDEVILRKSRQIALSKEKSLSQWLTELIERAVNEEGRYNRAKKRALKRLKGGFHLGGTPLARDEIHER